jgi:hypothetical protein
MQSVEIMTTSSRKLTYKFYHSKKERNYFWFCFYKFVSLRIRNNNSNKIGFCQYLTEFNAGVSTRKTYGIKRVDTNYFEE